MEHERTRSADLIPDDGDGHRGPFRYDTALAGADDRDTFGCLQALCSFQQVPCFRAGMAVHEIARFKSRWKNRFHISSGVPDSAAGLQGTDNSDPFTGIRHPGHFGNRE
jgi:hypothetical protein